MLGFELQEDFPVGEYRWLTLTAPGDSRGTQLRLEPDAHRAVGPFKAALVADGIPFTSFAVDDVNVEYARLSLLGVRFPRSRPTSGRRRPQCWKTAVAT